MSDRDHRRHDRAGAGPTTSHRSGGGTPGKRTRTGTLPPRTDRRPPSATHDDAHDAEPAAHRGPQDDPFGLHVGTNEGRARIARAQAAVDDLQGIAGKVAAFARSRDQLDYDTAASQSHQILAQLDHADDTYRALGDHVAPSDDDAAQHDANHAADLGALSPTWGLVGALLPLAVEQATTELGPHRFAGRNVTEGADAHIGRNLTRSIAALRREARETIDLLKIAALIRDHWIAVSGMPTDDLKRQIGDQLALLVTRPVRFAFVKAALSSIGLWEHIATYAAPKAVRETRTLGGVVANATATDRTVADLDHESTVRTHQTGAMVDTHGFDVATAIDLLEGSTGIMYIDEGHTLVSRKSRNAGDVFQMIAPLDDTARSAVLELFHRANVLDLLCGGLPPNKVKWLHGRLTGGHGAVAGVLGPYYLQRGSADHSIGRHLNAIPGVGGALDEVFNIATVGFAHEHDASYRAMRRGDKTADDYAADTLAAGERAGVVLALSAVGGSAGASFARGATGAVLGSELAATGAGRFAGTVAAGMGGGAVGNVGAQAGSDLVDGKLSSADQYIGAARTGAAVGGVLAGGAAVVGEAAPVIADAVPASVRAPLAALARRFPSIPANGPIMEAIERMSERAGASVGTAARPAIVRVIVAPTEALDAITAGLLRATPTARAVVARAAAVGDAAAARALKALGIDLDTFGGPPPAVAGAPSGARIEIELAPTAADDAAAATIVEARKLPGSGDSPTAADDAAAARDADDTTARPDSKATESRTDSPRQSVADELVVAESAAAIRARIVQAIGDVPISSVPSANGRPTYFITRAHGAELKQLLAQLPEVRATEFPRGITIHRNGSDWFLEWMPEQGAPANAIAASRGADHAGLPPSNASLVMFYGFRGIKMVDGVYWKNLPPERLALVRQELADNELLHYGHVGVSFDGGATVYGLTPRDPQLTAEELMRKVLNHEPLPAVVRDDTRTFVRARELAASGWDLEIATAALAMDDATRSAAFGENARLAAATDANTPTGKQYQFPYESPNEFGSHYPNDHTRNCATYPQMLGLCVPEPSGQLRDYITELKTWHRNSPTDIGTVPKTEKMP